MSSKTVVKPTVQNWTVVPARGGFQDIIWLAGQVFLWRDFAKKSLEAVLQERPYWDLDQEQQATFAACFNHPELRQVVAEWWRVYDQVRADEEIPEAGYWYGSVSEYQDVTWLAGQVFLWRQFTPSAGQKGLDAMFAQCPYGDLSAQQRATFEAAFNHPRLRRVLELWWRTYDSARAMQIVPQAGFWEAWTSKPGIKNKER